MYVATTYEMDNGTLLSFQVAIYIKSNGKLLQNQQIESDSLIPSILFSEITWLSNACPTKQVAARYVDIISVFGDVLQIGYPFCPGTANWFTFWEQLQSPDIISIKGFGEKVTNKFLKTSLELP